MKRVKEAIHAFFHNEKLRRFYVSFRKILVPIAIAAVLYFAKTELFWPAFAVSLFGELIQLWCFAALDKQSSLAFNGLYKFCRNPMYLGRYFIVLGYFMLPGNVWLIIAYSLFYYLYMWHRVQREEVTLEKIFGEPYLVYCRTVNRFFPTLPGMPGGKMLFWQWRLFRQNHGLINLTALLISYLVAYLWLRYRPDAG